MKDLKLKSLPSSLKESHVVVIKTLYKSDHYTRASLALEFDVHPEVIDDIITGKIWSHVKEGVTY